MPAKAQEAFEQVWEAGKRAVSKGEDTPRRAFCTRDQCQKD